MKQAIRGILAQLVSSLPMGVLTDKQFFKLYESKGYHITPVHFYQPVPSTEELPDELWEKPSELVGIDLNIPSQIELLESFQEFIQEFNQIPDASTKYSSTLFFAGVDAHILYSMIRKFQPKKIIEIGSGSSTLLSITALNKVGEMTNQYGKVIAIEPYPQAYLKDYLVGEHKLIQEKVEDLPLSLFEDLEENDILFIDSSHTVKIGNDVLYEFLEILPRLKKGVIIHIHDIFLPLPYPREMVKERYMFWAEQYLLQAFLAFNNSYQVLWSGAALKFYQKEKLASHFPAVFAENPDFIPGSFWIKKCQ
ncbi:class I SAM-dependent methyltransferase [Gloeocapsa sp. PCC 73106]|uniref:class I SAM-dependent methyltransferase n=1 Tax=Gloeocapsa sp. PCC 73106 TaxID=102232 RepID=UPI0002AC0A5C|nr:class I SAM-dependent methyltransferase [Gloeocapsa sp. PCC 73106]ELR97962.1 hypothetical protein GLO73106DRAFT_00017810 [Gloeocapsa sp. PCC 73106]